MKNVVHCRKEKFDVYIGRPSIFGNPFVMSDESQRTHVLEKYKEYFYNRVEIDPKFRAAALSLRGKVLGCYCKPKACHGDIIVEWLENNVS